MPNYNSTSRVPFKTGGRVGKQIGGRANLLEEVGRIDAERMNPNRRAEKARVIGELNKGYNKGGRVGLKHGTKKSEWITKKDKPELKTSQGQAGLKPKLKEPEKEYITKKEPKKTYITKKKDYETGEHYNKGGRVGLKKGSNGKWIQSATASIKRRGTEGVCTGKKFGGPTCPPGSKRYNLAKTFKKMGKARKA
jgi:hypothetical protein